ncbi:LGFP repeat-containing protein [Corynebacterium liangguodongii]|uniref:Uncharacterized protein n=1 Tax=Corynebacterium liangguodongii TaxID=2079535 RepID=A0A2S0WD86_9CORY|nr:hypothetical protein [Corynebacterium liangguodongii]AWB83735.1 hypothetical protein C3E79_03905 [Corynebacterium liangguodongii]PWB99455.1 hypothetical protein DF219_05890 [Corynebacterium liangguodongii]
MNTQRTIAAAVAAAMLATGLAACSSAEQGGAGEKTTVEETATETNTVKESAPAEAKGETVPVTTADGQQAMVPAGLAEAMKTYAEQPAWGEPLKVEEKEGGWIASYDNGHYVTWNENTGGAPTWGEIANNWLTTVEPEQNLGFPVAPEKKIENGSGWVQEFENGTIEWARGGSNGEFQANVNVK